MEYTNSRPMLVEATNDYIIDHGETMSILDLAAWAYIPAARQWLDIHMASHVSEWVHWQSAIEDIQAARWNDEIDVAQYMQAHVDAAMAMVMTSSNTELDFTNIGDTFIDDQLLWIWAETGCMLPPDWCDLMPMSPAISKALHSTSNVLDHDGAATIINVLDAERYVHLHRYASTGQVNDLHCVAKELDDCLTEWQEDDDFIYWLNGLVLRICLHINGYGF